MNHVCSPCRSDRDLLDHEESQDSEGCTGLPFIRETDDTVQMLLRTASVTLLFGQLVAGLPTAVFSADGI